MPLKVWDGSAFTMAGQVKVWNGSSWVQAKAAKAWNGSSWVQFHPGVELQEYGITSGAVTLAASGSDSSPGTADAEVEVILNSSGTATYRYTTNNSGPVDFATYDWLLSGANSDYYAYMDSPAGNAYTSGSATGTALQLNATRSWRLKVMQVFAGSSSRSNSSTLRIKTASGVDIVTIPVAMSVDATVF